MELGVCWLARFVWCMAATEEIAWRKLGFRAHLTRGLLFGAENDNPHGLREPAPALTDILAAFTPTGDRDWDNGRIILSSQHH